MLARQLAAHLHARLADIDAGNGAVGPRKIDILENAKRASRGGERPFRTDAGIVNDHDLARFHFADVFGLNQVQCATLRGEDVGAVLLADAERPEAVGIAKAEDLALAHEHDRERAFDAPQRGKHASRAARLREQVKDDFAVDGGLEDGAFGFEFLPQLRGIDEVAVVTDRDLAAASIHNERLRVLDRA